MIKAVSAFKNKLSKAVAAMNAEVGKAAHAMQADQEERRKRLTIAPLKVRSAESMRSAARPGDGIDPGAKVGAPRTSLGAGKALGAGAGVSKSPAQGLALRPALSTPATGVATSGGPRSYSWRAPKK